MKRISVLLLAVLLSFCLAACGEGTQAPTESNQSDQSTTSETASESTESLPEGVTVDEEGNHVIELTDENWSEYFELIPALTPESIGDNGVGNFVCFGELRLKEGYQERLVDCKFDSLFSIQKRQGVLLTYNTETKETTVKEYTESEWNALENPDAPYTEEWNGMRFSVSAEKSDFDKGEPILVTEDRVSIYQLHTTRSEDGKEYSIPASIHVEYEAYQTQGNITLKP